MELCLSVDEWTKENVAFPHTCLLFIHKSINYVVCRTTVEPEIILLQETSQVQKGKCHIFYFTCGLKKEWRQSNGQKKDDEKHGKRKEWIRKQGKRSSLEIIPSQYTYNIRKYHKEDTIFTMNMYLYNVKILPAYSL